MKTNLYFYKAVISSVYDGDTCTADIDLGLSVTVKGEKLRLSRINAPEVRGESRSRGILSRDFLREKIEGKEVIIQTFKDSKGKYGRFIAEIMLEDDNGELHNMNDLLVEKGFAQYVEY